MSVLLKIIEISLQTERSHCMQDKRVLAKELEVYDIESLCESMQIFSRDNPGSIHRNVVRPFVLKNLHLFRK